MSFISKLFKSAGGIAQLIPGVGTAVGTALQIGGNIIGNALEERDERKNAVAATQQQFENEKSLMGLQYNYNEKIAESNQQRNLEMWEKTNYPAQMEQIKKAGLSPGLIYGQTGAGGASTSGGQGTGVGNPGTQAVAMGLQLRQIEAQTELMEAQAAKAKAEVPNIQSDTKLKESMTKVNETVQDLNKSIQNLNESNTKLSKEQARTEQIKQEQLASEAYKAWMEGVKVNVEGQIREKELNIFDDLMTADIGVKIAIALKENSEVQLNQQQISKLKEDIVYLRNKITIENKSVDNAIKETENRRRYWVESIGLRDKELEQRVNEMWVNAATQGLENLIKILPIPGKGVKKNKR